MLVASIVVPSVGQAQQASQQQSKVIVDRDGIVHIPAFDMPLSSYMSEEAKRAYIDMVLNPPPLVMGAGIAKVRETLDLYFHAPLLKRAKTLYPVTIEEKRIAGVRTDVVTPKDGVAKQNRDRVLINLHGGGFSVGAGMGGLIESVPIAGVGKIKIISVDYREGPEIKFPAASEDVAAVYTELLKLYKPENIGIYGCSAGGVLTAMAMAWFQKEKLPNPGAIGIFCAGADAILGGDSSYTTAPLAALFRQPTPPANPNPPPLPLEYLSNADPKDPLVSPVLYPEVLSKFPPTLLIAGTRGRELSAAAYTHAQLVKAGVDADLHVWEGMWHAFFFDVDLPESIEAFDVIVKFFDKHLGRSFR